jgi:hypothetical protein
MRAIRSRYFVWNTILNPLVPDAFAGFAAAAATGAFADPVRRSFSRRSMRLDQHQFVDANPVDQAIGNPRSDHRPERCPETDDRKEALAFILRIHVVGERPELGDDHQVEDADPDEEDDCQRDLHLGERIEEEQTRQEEHRDEVDQPHPRELRDQPAVQRHHERQQHHLGGGHIRLQLGRSFPQDERLPHRLQDVVRHQDQEDVQRQQQRGRAFTGVHVGEHAEKTFQARAFR